MEDLKILHISTSKFRGAGIASLKLHEYILSASISSYFIAQESERVGTTYQKLAEIRKRFISDKCWLKITRKDKEKQKYSLHSINDFRLKTDALEILSKVPFKPNVILIHWVSGFISPRTINELYQLTKAKIYWTMMDNAPITGGCHYPWNCKGYKEECGFCPGLKSNKKNDLSNINLLQKKKLLEDVDISLISFSESDYIRTQNSSVFSTKKKYKLFLPVNEELYMPSKYQHKLKQKWKIPPDYKVILVGASNVQDSRKGIHLVYKAIKLLPLKNTIFLLIGNADNDCILNFGENVIYAGTVNEKELVECFQVSDYFLCPSLEDSGPYMINQSLMCGTPVVSFNIGISIEFVKTGETGYNCGKPSVLSLIDGMKFMDSLDKENLRKIRVECRQLALKKLKIDKFISSFLSIIKD